ncbi:hypothetical protein AB7942_29110 [Neobacillus sp. BF23-41]|uniref:hypothetical protein n=1 Tax=Neobacillus sp. BF23-41 TaxID=3240280 RepID=UPI0034E3BFE4
MDKYNRLFDLKRYKDEEDICFSINRDLEENAYYLSQSLCSRVKYIGKAYQLHYIPMIDIYGDVKFNKTQVFSLIDELLFIKSVVNDSVIDYFIPSLIELLEKITHSQDEDTLWIMGN